MSNGGQQRGGGSRPQVPQRGQGQAQQWDELAPDAGFKQLMLNRRKEVSCLFPDSISDERFKRLVVVAVNAYRRLLNDQKPGAKPIDPWSVMETTIAAAQLGLEAGTEQAYMVPYGGRVQLIVGPRGLIDIAYRSGMVASIEVEAVREKDDFDYMLGDKAFIRHRKAERRSDTKIPPCEGDASEWRKNMVEIVRGPLRAAWAKIVLVGSGDVEARTIRRVLTLDDVEFYRSFSKATFGPWFENTSAMFEKTVLKRGLKTAPRTQLVEIAMREDDNGAFVMPEGGIPATATTAKAVDAPVLEEKHTQSVGEQLQNAGVTDEDMERARRIDAGEEEKQKARDPEDWVR